MKKIWILSLLWICLLFTGCFNNRQALPENPIIFNETEIDWNWAIENDWKYYFAYITIKPKWVIWDFNYAFWDCLWYVGDDKNDRIYELNGESADEWLIKYYVNGEMEMPMILREISISNKNYIPENVEEPEKDIRFPDSNPIYWWVWTHEIVGDKTIYYNSWYWISFRLWEEFSWGRIVERDTKEWDTINENLYNLHRIEVYKKDWWWEWYGQVFIINVVNNEQSKIWEREHVIWNNNKYSFYSTNLKNWIVDITNERVTDMYIFDVKPEEDIPEWWWERITIVTDMCEEEWWKLDYWNWAEICVFWEDNRCYFDDLAYWNCRNGNIQEDEPYSEFLDAIKSSWEQPQRINDYPEETENLNVLDITDKTMDTEYLINLTIWDKNFDVILENNSATRALYEKLKEWNVVVNAKEYWWFEKVWNLGFSLPREDKQITTQLWDLVLYNWNQVSLFYDSNSWSYTKLWKVQNITESDFWDWDITLTFSLKN